MIFCTDPLSWGKKRGESDLEQGTLRTRVWGLSGPGYHADQVSSMHHRGIPLSNYRLGGRICRNRRIIH